MISLGFTQFKEFHQTFLSRVPTCIQHFQGETEFCSTVFSSGLWGAHILATVTCVLCIRQSWAIRQPDETLEILMSGMDPAVMDYMKDGVIGKEATHERNLT